MNRWQQIRQLRRRRPKDRVLRTSVLAALGLILASILLQDFGFTELLSADRRAQALQFAQDELLPHELQGRPFSWTEWGGWIATRWEDPGRHAALSTLAIAVVSIFLAALVGAMLAPLAARNLMAAEPFETLQAGRRRRGSRLRRGLVLSARTVFVLCRAIPEYFWAFLLLAVLGPTAWPAILALALHNSGSLGRLGADTIENLDPRTPRALRDLGASRPQLMLCAAVPLGGNRLLSYLFYRFETGIREATVLGMLGISSLGYWIRDARARQHYDDMLFLVLLAVGLVLMADLASVGIRALTGARRR